MAPFRWALLVSLAPLLLAGDAPPAGPQSHQHRGAPRHHRSPPTPSWLPRHGQYPHGRHNHEALLQQRRDSRLLGHRVRASTPPSTTTSTSTTTVRSSPRPFGRSRDERLVLEASRSSALAEQRRDAYASTYSGYASTQPSVYNKFQPGRRVCSWPSEATASLSHHHRSRLSRQAYTDLPSGYFCCPGWTQVTRLSYGCNKPVCTLPCQNGGVCSSPGKCTCAKGFTGNYCQIDVDECVTEKPCDQICRNVPGTYECYCRNGYELQPDRQSCRKNDSDGTALEARDLEEDFEETTTPTTRRPTLRDTENEVADGAVEGSYEELLQRLIKLEKQFAKEKKQEFETNEITTRIALAIDSINEIRRSVQNMQLMQQEIYDLRNKVKLYEFETRKIQHLSNRVIDLENRLRLRCRSGVYLSSGSSY